MNAQSYLRANTQNRSCFYLMLICINEVPPAYPIWCGNLMVRKARPPLTHRLGDLRGEATPGER